MVETTSPAQESTARETNHEAVSKRCRIKNQDVTTDTRISHKREERPGGKTPIYKQRGSAKLQKKRTLLSKTNELYALAKKAKNSRRRKPSNNSGTLDRATPETDQAPSFRFPSICTFRDHDCVTS